MSNTKKNKSDWLKTNNGVLIFSRLSKAFLGANPNPSSKKVDYLQILMGTKIIPKNNQNPEFNTVKS